MIPQQIGRYEVIRELGRGGMATVYHATDPSFDRPVAIKALPREFLHDPTFRGRFEREAKTIAALEHPCIVPVYDYGEHEDQLYLVMRYMSGASLDERISEGALSLDQASAILDRISSALDEAHNRGIIHRDLKPANILFDRNGEAYLSDFGIAKLVEAGGSLTGTGIIGTPAYMSPEQARGEKDIDGRSDIYALGVILFEMLTSQQPFESDTPMGVAVKHILDPAPEIRAVNPDLPEDVENLISRALAKPREFRYATASDLSRALAVIAAGQPLPEDLRLAEGAEGMHTLPIAVTSPIPVSQNAVTGVPAAFVETEQGEATADIRVDISKRERRRAERRVHRSERRGRPWLIGCIGVALLGVLLGFVGIGMGSAFMAAIFAQTGIPVGRWIGEATGELVVHDIEQSLANIQDLDLVIELGATETEIEALDLDDSPDMAILGAYEADAAREELSVSYEEQGGSGKLIIDQADPSLFILGEDSLGELSLGLNPNIPINLTLSSGIGDAVLDLSDLNIRSLSVEGGAGLLRVRLPENSNIEVEVFGGAGEIIIEAPEDATGLDLRGLTVRGGFGAMTIELPGNGVYDAEIEVGLGNLVIKAPDDLAATIELTEGGADFTMLNDRFVELDAQHWETDDFTTASNRATIIITVGAGRIRIED